MPRPLTPPEEPVDGRRHAVRGHATSAPSVRMEVLGRRRPDACAPRSSGRSPRWSPTRSTSTRWSPVGPALFAVKPPEAETWAPVTFYELPTGERYVHFGVARHPAGATDGPVPAARRPARARRVRVAVGRPRRGGAAPPTSSPGSARPGSASRRRRIVVDGRTHLRWRLGDRPVAGAGARPPRHGLAAGLAGDAPVLRRGRRAARPGLLRHEGRPGDGLPRPGGAGRPRRRHAARHRRRGDRLADLARAHRGGGAGGVGRPGARGLGRRRRAQDRAQGRLAVRRPRARPGRARRARARARASTPPSSWPTRRWPSRRSATRRAAPRSRRP